MLSNISHTRKSQSRVFYPVHSAEPGLKGGELFGNSKGREPVTMGDVIYICHNQAHCFIQLAYSKFLNGKYSAFSF